MVLTYNYGDLQKIKKDWLEDKIKKNNKIYFCIESYKETLNFMYDSNLAQNLSKEYLENELKDFVNSLLVNTNLSYKELEKQYKNQFITNYNTYTNSIRLKL